MAAMTSQHEMMMERVGESILQVAEAQEKKLDSKLKELENLGALILLMMRKIPKQNIPNFR